MKKNISISIDEETYKTFRVALDFSGQTEEEALMQSIHSYIVLFQTLLLLSHMK